MKFMYLFGLLLLFGATFAVSANAIEQASATAVLQKNDAVAVGRSVNATSVEVEDETDVDEEDDVPEIEAISVDEDEAEETEDDTRNKQNERAKETRRVVVVSTEDTEDEVDEETDAVPESGKAYSVILNERNKVVMMFEGARWYTGCSASVSAARDDICDNERLTQIIYQEGKQPQVRVIKSSKEKPKVVVMPVTARAVEVSQAEPVEHVYANETNESDEELGCTASSTNARCRLTKRVEMEVQGIRVIERTAAEDVEVDIAGQNKRLRVVKANENGKIILGDDQVSAETEEQIVVDEEADAVYIADEKGKQYQLYLTPNAVAELARKHGYEPAQSAQLFMKNKMPTYKIYAKKPVKFLWFTIGEEEVVLNIDQTGEVVEEELTQ